jgi:hypothetical protein
VHIVGKSVSCTFCWCVIHQYRTCSLCDWASKVKRSQKISVFFVTSHWLATSFSERDFFGHRCTRALWLLSYCLRFQRSKVADLSEFFVLWNFFNFLPTQCWRTVIFGRLVWNVMCQNGSLWNCSWK